MKASNVGFALRAGSGLTALAIAGLSATPVFAQVTPAPSGQPATTSPNNTTTQSPSSPELQTPAPGKGANGRMTTTDQKGEQAIVITGTVSRQTQTASPVTVVSASNLQDRGITSVADAIQELPANNAGADPASWSPFGFATGASAPSLRGFNDAYTITLFDGLRTAYYPLADDGYRNFVDINTIPESIVDRIEVLQDGASANYGADAVAGVVNVIIKKEIRGIHGNASYGVSEKGDAKEKRFDLTLGYGSLADQGFNVYVNGEYQKNDPLFFRQRGYPYNTADQSQICGTSVYDGSQTCNFNGVVNGIQAGGGYNGFGSTRVGYGLPYSAPGVLATPTPQTWQLLNPTAGCSGLTAVTLTPAQIAGASSAAVTVPSTVCQQDLVNQYREYDPTITRKGLNFHATVNITPDIQAYAMANWYEVSTANSSTPLSLTSAQTAAGGPLGTISRIYLPAYVCPTATPVFTSTNQVYFTGCNASNGVLNPNNPFAAQGNMARLVDRFIEPRQAFTDANTYRFSTGVSGSFSGFNFNVDATTSRIDLKVRETGNLQLRDYLEAIGQGTYNFVDQTANSQATLDSIAPPVTNVSTSKLTEITGTIGRDFAQLPGGALNVAVGASYRTESITNPSANPINTLDPINRYESVNAVSASGKRNVWAGYYSVDVPAFTGFDFKAEGRYDHYSNGLGSAFSPKFELQYKPISAIKLRATYSRGFRVPSFNEVDTSGVPTTGYITSTINCTTYAAFCAAHATNKAYYQGSYSYGLSSVGNTQLKPEKSASWTAGLVVTPTNQLTLTADYWYTKIKQIIIPSTQNPAFINQYYLNNGAVTVPAGSGISLIPGIPDPSNPGALPLLGFYQAPYINSSSEVGSGIDLSATMRVPLNHSGLRLISALSGSYLGQLTLKDPNLGTQKYAGTLSPCNITSCSGAPRWRGQWQNTLDFSGRASISATAYYTSGYSDISTDTGGIIGDCIASAENGSMSQTFNDGSPIRCHIKGTWDVDLTAQIKLFHSVTLYGNVLNVFNTKPPYDPNAAYGIYQFNPAWADKNFIGRYFRIGARFDLDAASPAPAPYVAPPAPPPPPAAATQTCPDGTVILATAACPVAPPPPPPPPAAKPERGQ